MMHQYKNCVWTKEILYLDYHYYYYNYYNNYKHVRVLHIDIEYTKVIEICTYYHHPSLNTHESRLSFS